MPRSATVAGATRWARTGVRLTWKQWREDYLAGVLWIAGIFVVLWVVAAAVGAMGG